MAEPEEIRSFIESDLKGKAPLFGKRILITMAEPEEIRSFIESDLKGKAPLFGKRILITAGPTQEPIDPVRYIGNRSTGKMGYAIAEAALALGAEVDLVSGPASIDPPRGTNLIGVKTAQEMFDAATPLFGSCDVAILSAAVADYRPRRVADQKMKKSSDDLTIGLEPTRDMTIGLEPTRDILKTLGEKKSNQILVGFALETNNALENAKGKLQRKNCDLIVLNSLADARAGFGYDTNKVTFVTGNKIQETELKPKRDIAIELLHFIKEQFL